MLTYSISEKQIDAWRPVLSENKRWKKAVKEPTNFSYGTDSMRGEIEPLRINLKYFHDKYHFFKILRKSNVKCCPKTYISMDEFMYNRKKDNSMWFFKLSTLDCGSGVTPFFDRDDDVNRVQKEMENRCGCSECKSDEYVIQKCVDNIMLYNGYKFDIRIHILVTGDGDIYVYKNACMRISLKKYSSKCACKKHQLTNGFLGANVQYTDKWPKWESVYPSVNRSILEVFSTMKNYFRKGKYLLFGADFIIDNNKNAWILELNTYPCLYYEQTPHMQPTITHMLSNMVKIIMDENYDKSNYSLYSWDYVGNLEY